MGDLIVPPDCNIPERHYFCRGKRRLVLAVWPKQEKFVEDQELLLQATTQCGKTLGLLTKEAGRGMAKGKMLEQQEQSAGATRQRVNILQEKSFNITKPDMRRGAINGILMPKEEGGGRLLL
eukprot:c6245_g1_i1 orf=277-642(+)